MEETHQNIFNLITAINEKKGDQKTKWQELKDKAAMRQKAIRLYTEQYYLGSSKHLEGNWLVKGETSTVVSISNKKISANWIEPGGLLGGSGYVVEVTGEVTGSTFMGNYTRKKQEDTPTSLMGMSGNVSNPCIGYLSEGGEKLHLMSTKIKEEFSLSISRQNA